MRSTRSIWVRRLTHILRFHESCPRLLFSSMIWFRLWDSFGYVDVWWLEWLFHGIHIIETSHGIVYDAVCEEWSLEM